MGMSLNSAFLLLANSLSGFRLKSMYISLIVSTTSSTTTWFSAACVAVTVHRNHFLYLYQQNKSYESKGKFRQASGRCKKVLEAAKLAYATKTNEFITSQKLGCRDAWRIANSALNKGKSVIPPLFNGQ